MTEWNKVNWRKLERRLFKLQKRIYRAAQRDDSRTVRRLQKTVMKSWTARMIAVRRVTQENKGKNTAGVDGVKSLTPPIRFSLVNELKNHPKPKPTRRVWIPKPGSHEKRPLGIPTMCDRALQALAKIALEPEWEAKFEPNSYGFRAGRSCHDAIQAIFSAIHIKPKWVLDADIKGCFDRINQEALLRKLNTYPAMRKLVKGWLKAGVMDNGAFHFSNEGTPQGGVISPLLANIALHGMEYRIKQYAETLKGGKRSNKQALNLIRYADDFVILHHDRKVIEDCKLVITEWLKDMGLELKSSKTHITHTLQPQEDSLPGFKFLGFNLRQYNVGKCHSKQGFKTIITPSSKAVSTHYEQISSIIERNKTAPQSALIKQLNPIIRGWANYFRTVCSTDTFQKLDHMVWNKLRRWAFQRHPNKPKQWVINKYWGTRGGNNWSFQTENAWLMRHSEVSINRHVKVSGNSSPFDGNLLYWSQRLSKYPQMPPQKAKLLKRQQGKCNHCGLYFRDGDILEVHHIQPQHRGGNHQLENLELLHLHCHDEKHGINVNDSYTEEPDEVKISSPVLKTSYPGDEVA